jgi:hypothetical protein
MRGARIRVKPGIEPATGDTCYIVPGPGVSIWEQDGRTCIALPYQDRVIITTMTFDEVAAELDAALRRETRDGSP